MRVWLIHRENHVGISSALNARVGSGRETLWVTKHVKPTGGVGRGGRRVLCIGSRHRGEQTQCSGEPLSFLQVV